MAAHLSFGISEELTHNHFFNLLISKWNLIWWTIIFLIVFPSFHCMRKFLLHCVIARWSIIWASWPLQPASHFAIMTWDQHACFWFPNHGMPFHTSFHPSLYYFMFRLHLAFPKQFCSWIIDDYMLLHCYLHCMDFCSTANNDHFFSVSELWILTNIE